jgi:hypothetical protein
MLLFWEGPSAPWSPLPGKVELNEYRSIWVIRKVKIQQGPWKDWTNFRSHCCPMRHILSTSHLVPSFLLVEARTQCEVNNSKVQKLFECLY